MLAAGAGTRCYPFTYLAPKIFQQVGGIPLVEYMLSWFGGAPEIDELYIAVRGDTTAATLKDYVDRRKQYLDQILHLFQKLGYHVDYPNPDFSIKVIQANGWGTGGDLRCALDQMAIDASKESDFMVCYTDYIINRKLPDGTISLQMDLSGIIQCHERCSKNIGTVMTVAFVGVEREEATRFGVGKFEEVNGCKIVRGFIEKPSIEEIDAEPAINAGISVIKSQFLFPNMDKFLPKQPDTSLERNVMEQLTREERPMLAACLLDLDAWFDVGTLEHLINTNIYIASKKG